MARPESKTDFRPNVKRSARFARVTDQSLGRARAFRRALSPPEVKLWSRIRRRQLAGLRFRRQHPIGPYSADFYCDEARLIVELDGSAHRERVERDRARDEFIQSRGILTLRITVSDFERDIPAALDRIERTAITRIDEAREKR